MIQIFFLKIYVKKIKINDTFRTERIKNYFYVQENNYDWI